MPLPGFSPRPDPSHDELHATCGRTVPTQDGATLLPSTRLLLKRREVAEVERELQSQREVRGGPLSPSVCPLPGGLQSAMGDEELVGTSPAVQAPAPVPNSGAPTWDNAPSALRSRRNFGRGWSAWHSAGSS